MNVFKKNILKFILSFIFIIIVDVILLVTAANYIRSQQSASNIIETVSSEIVLTNGNYVVSPIAKQLIDENNLWLMIIDKNNNAAMRFCIFLPFLTSLNNRLLANSKIMTSWAPHSLSFLSGSLN